MGNIFVNFFANKSLLPMGGRTDTITLSGLSSGSMQGINLHVIYSDIFKGAGLMIGSSYWTADYWNDAKAFLEEDTAL